MIMMAAICAVLLFRSEACAADEDAFNVYGYFIRGPIRSNPEFNDWSVGMIETMYDERGIPLAEDAGFRLTTDLISQNADTLDNATLWLAVRVTSKDPNDKLSLRMLRFTVRSSDPANSLASTYAPNDPLQIYSPRALGVIWSEGGERVSDTLIRHGDAGQLVNEVCFIGIQVPYYIYSSAEGREAIDSYVRGFANGFELIGTCEVVDGESNVRARVQRTLQTVGEPVPPILSIRDIGSNMVSVGITMEANRSAIVQSRATFRSTSPWMTEATVNAGDELNRNVEADPTKYFRALLQ